MMRAAPESRPADAHDAGPLCFRIADASQLMLMMLVVTCHDSLVEAHVVVILSPCLSSGAHDAGLPLPYE